MQRRLWLNRQMNGVKERLVQRERFKSDRQLLSASAAVRRNGGRKWHRGNFIVIAAPVGGSGAE